MIQAFRFMLIAYFYDRMSNATTNMVNSTEAVTAGFIIAGCG
jgi:hypothetical protein